MFIKMTRKLFSALLLLGFIGWLLAPPRASCQLTRSSDQSDDIRGNRAEVAIVVKDASGQLIGPLVTVKFYYVGSLVDQKSTSKGRAVFILNRLGNYTITADAAGYRPAQKEISVPVAVEVEEDIVLQRDSAPEALGAAARPVLAPKAKEALDKALQSMNEDKLDQAQKHMDEAVKLAPNHPDVLYLQGVILLHRGQAQQAQAVLEKTTQIDPQNARAFTALGMAFLDENKFDLATAPLQQSIQLDPGNWEAHSTLARALFHLQKYDACLLEAQQALSQAHGSQPDVELLVAQAQVAVGKFDDAGETLRSFLRLHSADKGAPTARRWLDRLIADGKVRKQ